MPRRIVSLLPSATEMLCALGGQRLLVGRSHECDWPASIAHLPALTAQRITASASADIDRQVRETLGGEASSLYTLDTCLLKSLKPDLILTQDLCDVCSIDLKTVRAAAADLDPPPEVLSTNPVSINDVFDDMLRIAEAAELSLDPIAALRERSWQAREYVNAYTPGINTAFLEWIDPLFAGGHWTPELIEQAGGAHPLNPPGAKSRQITPDQLVESHPLRIIICPCGYDLTQIRRELHTLTSQRWWRELPAVESGDVMLVDGSQMFNRPGPRLVDALEWLVGWLNDRPDLMKDSFPAQRIADEQSQRVAR